MPDEVPLALVIESFEPGLDAELEALAGRFPQAVTLVRAKSFGAGQFTTQAVIEAVPLAAVVVTLVTTWIRSKRYMSVKLGGLELTGMSPREVERVLKTAAAGGDALLALGAVDEPTAPPPDAEAPAEHDTAD